MDGRWLVTGMLMLVLIGLADCSSSDHGSAEGLDRRERCALEGRLSIICPALCDEGHYLARKKTRLSFGSRLGVRCVHPSLRLNLPPSQRDYAARCGHYGPAA